MNPADVQLFLEDVKQYVVKRKDAEMMKRNDDDDDDEGERLRLGRVLRGMPWDVK